MNRLIQITILLSTLALAGCSVFSDKRKPMSLHELEFSTRNQEDVLQHYVNSAQHELLFLEKATQGRCLNGQLTIANLMFDRALSEYQNRLYKDAFITLTNFDRQVRKTRCILAYVEGKFGCKHTNKSSVLKRWYQEGKFEQCTVSSTGSIEELGNTVEQNEIIVETLHEFNSDEIKPIYFESLNKVAALVNIYPRSSISVTGHADSIGSNLYNLTLGKNRALKVAKYLTGKGVSVSKIIIKSNGENVLREKEKGDVSRVFNRYTTLTINLNIQGGTSLEGVSHD